MPIQVLMPALSPTMTEGNLAKWHKGEGDAVSSGDVLCEIETDKATMEVEAVEEGTLGRILVPAGTQGVAVNSPIALILEDGEDASALDSVVLATPTPAATSAPAPAAQPAPPPPSSAAPAAPSATAQAAPAGARVVASPLAKRLAANAGLDISQVAGSGPRGRVVKRDVEAAIAGGGAARATVPATAPQTGGAIAPVSAPGASYTDVPHSGMRKIIASRLQESKQTVPHFYVTVDCQIDQLLEHRKRLNAAAPEGANAYKISVNDFVVRAVALAMKQVPAVNASWMEEAMRVYNTVDVAIAVASPGGLVTPIVRNADQKGLATLSNEIRELAGRGREGKLMPEEYTGGGFTISNLGMYGVKEFSAIINPPQSCILAVGAGEQRPVVKDGALAIATVMTCVLSCDHRAVDGAVGAEFASAFKRLIEEPLTMML